MSKISEYDIIKLADTLNKCFNGDKKAMANYILHNLPSSAEQMYKNKEHREKAEKTVADVSKAFGNSRNVSLTGTCITRKKLHFIFTKLTENYVDDVYFKRKLKGVAEYNGFSTYRGNGKIQVTLEV